MVDIQRDKLYYYVITEMPRQMVMQDQDWDEMGRRDAMLNTEILDAILDKAEEDDDYVTTNNALADVIYSAIGDDDEKWQMVDDAISAYTFALVDQGVWDSNAPRNEDEQFAATLRDLTGEKWTMIHDAVSAYAHVVLGKGFEVGNALREADKRSIEAVSALMGKQTMVATL